MIALHAMIERSQTGDQLGGLLLKGFFLKIEKIKFDPTIRCHNMYLVF